MEMMGGCDVSSQKQSFMQTFMQTSCISVGCECVSVDVKYTKSSNYIR